MSFGTITRFRITPENSPPVFVAGEILNQLRKFCFQSIDEIYEEKSFGWTNFDDMLDTEFQITPPEKGEYFAFAFRVDTRRIPGPVLKKEIAEALKKEEAANREEGKRFVSRTRKKELCEIVKWRLLQRIPPIPQAYKVIWAPAQNMVLFCGPQGHTSELFSEYFTRSFDFNLEVVSPYALAFDTVSQGALDNLLPENFI